MTKIFHKGVQATDTQAIQPIASIQPVRQKREAPDAWGNLSYKAGDQEINLRNKFIRLESSKTEEEFLLNAYEAGIAKWEAEGHKTEDFEFKVNMTMTVVPADGQTRPEIVGELVMAS